MVWNYKLVCCNSQRSIRTSDLRRQPKYGCKEPDNNIVTFSFFADDRLFVIRMSDYCDL